MARLSAATAFSVVFEDRADCNGGSGDCGLTLFAVKLGSTGGSDTIDELFDVVGNENESGGVIAFPEKASV